MKKLVLTRLRNIKTLSKKDFELYSARIPIILDSIMSTFEESIADESEFHAFRTRLFKYVTNFMETGDALTALDLMTRIEERFNAALDTETKLLLLTVLAYLFAINGMDEEATTYVGRSFEVAGSELSLCFVFNLLTQSIVYLHQEAYDMSTSTAKRALDYLQANNLSSENDDLLPLSMEALQYRLTKVYCIGAMKVALQEKAGSRKRKVMFETSLAYVDQLGKFNSKQYTFFQLCEKALIKANMGFFSKAEPDLRKASELLSGNKDFFTAHSYYLYATRAYVQSCRCNFAEAYMDARLAFRASFNTPDAFMELYVMSVFLEIAKKFSTSFPEHRKNVSEFYMRGNSLLKQFVDFLQEKDWYTGKKHSSRVASLSYMIGRKMLTLYPYLKNQLDLQTLYLSAFVHDIGKLKLPWTLINKIGELRPYEKRYAFRHVVFSRDILEGLNFKDIARIVYQHHENMDGSGYPEGTRDISISANIISIADSFEAMTSANRKYKRQKSLVETRDELSSLKEIYLPEVIDAFRMIDLSRVDAVPED